ncbi:hypothetical protein TYRP_018669 [Tyrophagus putrescentiae]|nr:hypothetical protein TYRP_018669 [Tyrophagus putrescentiae]
MYGFKIFIKQSLNLKEIETGSGGTVAEQHPACPVNVAAVVGHVEVQQKAAHVGLQRNAHHDGHREEVNVAEQHLRHEVGGERAVQGEEDQRLFAVEVVEEKDEAKLPIVLPKLKDNKGETDGKVDAHQDEHVAKGEPDEAVEGDVQKHKHRTADVDNEREHLQRVHRQADHLPEGDLSSGQRQLKPVEEDGVGGNAGVNEVKLAVLEHENEDAISEENAAGWTERKQRKDEAVESDKVGKQKKVHLEEGNGVAVSLYGHRLGCGKMLLLHRPHLRLEELLPLDKGLLTTHQVRFVGDGRWQGPGRGYTDAHQGAQLIEELLLLLEELQVGHQLRIGRLAAVAKDLGGAGGAFCASPSLGGSSSSSKGTSSWSSSSSFFSLGVLFLPPTASLTCLISSSTSGSPVGSGSKVCGFLLRFLLWQRSAALQRHIGLLVEDGLVTALGRGVFKGRRGGLR